MFPNLLLLLTILLFNACGILLSNGNFTFELEGQGQGQGQFQYQALSYMLQNCRNFLMYTCNIYYLGLVLSGLL